ncbi:MAG: 50S ribosomal protein L3 [Deltaproteobacteria bacterium]|nr:50S ribosomal protein L3 [Deltaproteobacteria bacterium]
MFGLLGKKKGMTQVYDANGNVVPVTVVELGPCVVITKRTKKRDGYDALQLGFLPKKESRTRKPQLGLFKKRGLTPFQVLQEFRTQGAVDIAEGATLTASLFQVGDVVAVAGTTKGRGFQGAIKRHGKHGGPASHGSDFHRRPGSIGMRTQPGRVIPGMRMPGHMGVDRVTIRNLKVVAVRPEDHAVLIQGAIPGSREGIVEVLAADPAFTKRLTEKAPVSEEATQEVKE